MTFKQFSILVLIAMTTLTLSACGGGGGSSSSGTTSSATSTTSGIAVDPYLVGAVFEEVAADGGTIIQRASTASDANGKFIFPRALTAGSTVRLKISQRGMHGNSDFKGMIKRVVPAGSKASINVTPLTTLVANGASEDEVIKLFSDAGLNINRGQITANPMTAVEGKTSVTNGQLAALQANMALNAMLESKNNFNFGADDLNRADNFAVLQEMADAMKSMLNAAEFNSISSQLSTDTALSGPVKIDDLVYAVVEQMTTLVKQTKTNLKANGGSLNRATFANDLQTAMSNTAAATKTYAQQRQNSNPNPGPGVDGAAIFANNCQGCHNLGNGGLMDLTGKGATVETKINGGHQGKSLTTDELAALMAHVDGTGGGTTPPPDPGPTPGTPPNGTALYRTECSGCHGARANTDIQSRSVAGVEGAIANNLGGMSFLSTLTTEELQAIVDVLPALPDPGPGPGPAPDGQTLYDNNCSSCHKMGDYDTAGNPELGGKGNLIPGKINGGHMGVSLTTAELDALAVFSDANPPTTTPPPPTTPDGQALYDNNCSSCHKMGSYDTAGSPELGGKGNLIPGKINGGHMGFNLTTAELDALAVFSDANPPVTTPPPTAPVGKDVYDNNCAGCHSVNGYDASGAPDLAAKGNLISGKLAAGHNGQSLTTEEESVLSTFLDQYQAPATGPDYSDCTACHAQPPNGNSSPNTDGAHSVHAALPGVGNDCSICHTGADHNGQVDLGFPAAYNAKNSTATDNMDGTCSNISCHGGQTTPDWWTGNISVNSDCASCHTRGTSEYNSQNSGRHSKHRNYSCTSCHNTGKMSNHFGNLATPGLETDPASTIGGGSTRVGSYNGTSCSSIQCHGGEKW